MKIFIILILVLFVVSILVFFHSSVYVRVYLKKNELNKKAEVWIKYLFLKKRIYPPKGKKKKEKPEKPKKEMENKGLEHYKKKCEETIYIFNAIKEDVALLLKFARDRLIVIENLEFNFRFGLDDPMETGIASGIINGTYYTILGFLHNNIKIRKCKTDIAPDFDNVCHNISADCILRLKNVHITVIIVKIVRLYYKLKKVTKERK